MLTQAMIPVFGRILIFLMLAGCIVLAVNGRLSRLQRFYFGIAATLNAIGFFGMNALLYTFPGKVKDGVYNLLSPSGLLILVSLIAWLLSAIGLLSVGIRWLVRVMCRLTERK